MPRNDFIPFEIQENCSIFFLIKTTAPSFIIDLSRLPEIEDFIAEDTTMLAGGLIVPKGAIKAAKGALSYPAVTPTKANDQNDKLF